MENERLDGIVFEKDEVEILDTPKALPPIVNITNAPEPKALLFEKYEEVWFKAWIATATASNSTTTTSAKTWADSCLEEFKKRFGK